MSDDLIGLKGKKHTALTHTRDYTDKDLYQPTAQTKPQVFDWKAFIFPILLFLINKAAQSLVTLSADTKSIIDIIIVILIVTSLILYYHYHKRGKNG